ncbi:hypothetical protein ACVWY2_004204 [Bradyrhizobium sp. JR6.1]
MKIVSPSLMEAAAARQARRLSWGVLVDLLLERVLDAGRRRRIDDVAAEQSEGGLRTGKVAAHRHFGNLEELGGVLQVQRTTRFDRAAQPL